MRYVLVAVDLADLKPGLSRDYGAETPNYLCHSVARAYVRHWGLVATVHGKEYVANVETIKGVDLPVPIFERRCVGEASVETVDGFYIKYVDVSLYNDLMIIKFM